MIITNYIFSTHVTAQGSNSLVKTGNQSNRKPFNEYKSITNDEVNSEEFRAKYEKDFIIHGDMVSSSSDIIKALAKKMNKTEKATHLMVKRKFFKPPAEMQKNIIVSKNEGKSADKKNNILIDSSNESKSGNVIEENDNASTNAVESFCETFELEDGEIFEILLTKTKHRNKFVDKQRVKSGWPYKLGFFLFEKTKISCKFNFKNVWVAKNEEVTTFGACECNARANISFHHNILKVEIDNISQTFPHTRVYQIRGDRKAEFTQQLKHSSAKAVQSKLVNDLIPDNTELNVQHNPFVVSLNALHHLKQRDHNTDIDPIDVLLEWKDTTYQSVISAISHSPFYIFYRLELQLAWYIVESRKRKMSLSGDATGSLVKPPPRSQKIDGSSKLKHVFFYSFMAKTGNRSVPILQMVSQDQSTDFIIFFLKKMFKGLKLPSEIVCDESKALLKAFAVAFANQDNIEKYIAACMSSILYGTAAPACYIRIDRSHFVKNSTRKIKYRDFRKQNLFRGVIGYLIKCDNFRTARKIIHDFFTVILNENDGFDDVGPLQSECAKKRLITLCSTHEENADYASDFDALETEHTERDMDYKADETWIDEIIEKVIITKSENQHENLYYSPGDKGMFVKLFSSIVLWSNVMNPIFGSTAEVATSSDVESYFKTLKTGILGRKMYRPDEFFELHTDFVNSEIKLNSMSNSIVLTSPAQRNRSNSLNERPSISPGKSILNIFIGFDNYY